ncbi:hypothetical protein ABB37_00571 [Leptomonas pyrrhocoris]|uniref:Uncharacterized protein n=1 Tax=Leptomonas pyrrhocoris TaxID=157538 RepID=A0A0N0VI30_LEPPY|nr:hypothetical protein ABB37_00571 [Leptomonas pyrrhocoris]KPA86384.1 hypothetical protein ABB37_00571 [Leptomonas pyrrhocoris]|eukprot:XP_015664823.1 hypothetical protein ABB37_00571 [Leptomonas pyrrhocoris]
MEAKSDPTLTRRRQRRPDLQSAFDVPEDIQQLISNVAHTLMSGFTSRAKSNSAVAAKVVGAADKGLQELLQPSLTPAQQLHAISKVTGALKDVPKAQLGVLLTASSGELYTWGRTLALEAVVPMLLDCRVRYLHRALMTLLRVLVPTPDAHFEAVVREMYVTRVLRRAGAGALTAASTSSASEASPAAAAAAALYFPTATNDVHISISASRDAVLNFLNTVDGLTSTLMPMLPSVFNATFLEALPLLAECFQWVVVNATSHSHSQVGGDSSRGATAVAPPSTVAEEGEEVAVGTREEEEEGNKRAKEDTSGTKGTPSQALPGAVGGTVFGEDLEHIRFCVRVVATYIHKYMDSLTAAMLSCTAGGDVSRQLARLLQPTVVMLASPIFPKDVLNAVGLLVASILTVRTCDGWLLSAVCAALRDDVTQSAAGDAAGDAAGALEENKELSRGAPIKEAKSLADLFVCAEVALGVVCAADPQAAAQAHHSTGAKALHDLFTTFTPNGCFALLKGILAHVSSPIRGDWMSLGILLNPHGPASTVVAYDVIVPAAQVFCNAVQEPETRFMAIQTVDSVVRHVSAVLSGASAALRKSRDAAEEQRTLSSSGSAAVEKGAVLTEQARGHLTSLCVSTPKLQATLLIATQLIMSLWDDGTQQMSGALYGTYNEILKIKDTLHLCQQQQLTSGETSVVNGEADTAVTLDQILDVQAERRGKYHALLGHLSMMPLPNFVHVLQRHYRCEASMADAVAAFSRMLLSGASNHKIGNVAGDVFAQLAGALKSASSDKALNDDHHLSSSRNSTHTETVASVLRKGIVEPLARAMTDKGYVSVSSNVSEAVNISHIAAHFAAPLMKQDPSFLTTILSAIGDGSATLADVKESHACERLEQGVVEVLSRARGVGIDIAPYIAPGSTVLSVLEASMHSLNYEVRNSALCLCVLGSKKIQAVQRWQLQKVEKYLILNMHLGGDSTARKGLLEMLKKWARRLMESYTSKGINAGDSHDATKASKKQRKEERADVAAPPSAPPPEATSDVLELGTPAYRDAVMQHCVRLAEIFAQNIGVNLRASSGLAVERRVTAMMGYVVLVQGLRTVVKGEKQEKLWLATQENARQGLLHVCTVPSLIATLSDGWSQARDSAQELLQLFCELAPAAVFAEARGVSSDDANASCSALTEQAHQDLLKAQTYRNAEGAVRRFLLFSMHSFTAQANAQLHPQQELDRLNGLLEVERTSVLAKCAYMSAMRGSSSYAYIQANPLHGSLSLCAELLGCMSAVDRHLSLCVAPGGEATAVLGGPVLTQACTQLLRCCGVVLRTCSSLVGTETVTAGATAGVGADEVVDCRGHVYDRSRPEAESVMRGVVNNTWLSMRVSTTAVDRVLKVRAVHLLPFDVVRSTAYELVHALLLTKHNGVMRCVREALKSLTATLVRSRAPQFYQLPAELLEYLLGPEGVTSGDMARMLRRSQGLPHAILAVLEAEDTAVPYCLFPSAMRQLTRVARGNFQVAEGTVGHFNSLGSTLDDVRRSQRSNALNVLKFIFEDKVFADRVVAYIEEAFSLATEGFHDASWYTRNSSLMLFSAVLHRFVGEHPSTGGSGVNTSLHDVAKRTPRGVAYAYAELMRGNGLIEDVVAGDVSSSSPPAGVSASVEVNVALFPVLQLLSMLSPDPPHLLTKASHGEWDDAARISEAVRQCAGSPSLMVRSASAVALCCLVPIASLPRVIARTRRGLALLPCEAAPLSCDVSDEGCPQEKPQPNGGGGVNACHGALLQLLQFHAQYVGTLRRHYKQKRSSYATPAVAEEVCHAICEVVLSCHAVLVRVCAVCPTVAAAVFGLLADLVYYGPQQHLSDSQQQALRGLCVASLQAYVLSSQGVLERGSVMEGASAVVIFMAAQHCVPVGAWSAAEQQCVAQILNHEAAALDIRKGEHNLISWVAVQLIHYGDHKTGVLDRDAMAAVLQVLAGEVQCDIRSLVSQTLTDFFESGAVAASTPAATMPNIRCLSWGQLVTHLRFTAASLTLSSNNGVSDAEQTFSAGVSSSAIDRLYEIVVHLLSSTVNDDDAASAAVGSLWQNSDACSAALDLAACYDMHAAAAAARVISPRLARTLAYFAEPEQPLEARLAVVQALRTAQPFLRRSVSAPSCPESAVTLFLILLRLLVDDTSNIREAASTICSHCLWGPQEAPRDQVSCLLAVVRLLRQLHARGELPSAAAAKTILVVTEVTDGGATLKDLTAAGKVELDDEEDRDAEDDANGEDVLFQKEAANMFAEETVLLCLSGHIFGVDASHDVAVACRSFSVFDELLK